MNQHRMLRPITTLLLVLGFVACQGDAVPTAPSGHTGPAIAEGGNPGPESPILGFPNPEPAPAPGGESDPDAGADDGPPSDGGETPGGTPSDGVDEPTDAPDDSASESDALAAALADEIARLEALRGPMDLLFRDSETAWLTSLLSATSELLTCAPQRYAFDVQVIGPAGGTLQAGDQRLVIPSGALSAPRVISMVALPTAEIQVDLAPHGTVFARTATLALDYSACPRSELPRGALRIAYVNDDGGIIEYLPSKDDRRNRTVEGDLDHFSRYAIAR